METKHAKNPGLFPMFPFSCISTSTLSAVQYIMLLFLDMEFPSPRNRHGNSQNSQEFPIDSREFPELGLELETGVTDAFSATSPTSKTYGLLASYRSVTQRLGTWVYATQPQ